MTVTFTPSPFTSPDIRPTGPAALPATDEQYEVLDMLQVQQELAAALRHIEDLPRQHPYEASGYRREPVYQPIPPGTESDRAGGNAKANINTNLAGHTPISPPGT